MTEVSQNGWTVLQASSTKWWNLIDSSVRFQLRRGSAGFVLMHCFDWIDRKIERLEVPAGDDFGWALRRISGTDIWSNHASGTAGDLNASKHPQGDRGTWKPDAYDKINERIDNLYDGLIRWGANFSTIVDEMHLEINGTPSQILVLSKKLEQSPRGITLLSVN